MKITTIEDLGYLIKQAYQNNQPKPIVFLGAGASKTGQIPLANEIVAEILRDYPDIPAIKRLKDEEKTYPRLMECLTPYDRNKLLKGYIEAAKINVSHIYLAQFIKAGLIDYVLTVNFDNLMLRALALINEFPPTYDMAILKDLTTTSFKEKSVVYLHGQHHGLWLLNTPEEMEKVKAIVPRILDSIKNGRPWIFVGYSGQDPIFQHIAQLGRFDNGLYWVTYYDDNPNETVCTGLLDKANANAHLIKGYDSDSFFMKLHNELRDCADLKHPEIIHTPFSALNNALDNIVDIDDKDHFKGLKQRLADAKQAVALSIRRFEEGVTIDDKNFIDLSLIKKQINDLIANEDYDENKIKALTEKVNKTDDPDLKNDLAELYFNWADQLGEQGEKLNDEMSYERAISKYQQVIILNPQAAGAFNNWGNALNSLATLKQDPFLYEQSIEKFQRATSLDSNHPFAFNNWGNALCDLARFRQDPDLYEQSFEKYRQATLLDPRYALAFNNWGISLCGLAKLKQDPALCEQSFEKFRKARIIEPKNANTFYNWSNALLILSRLTKESEQKQRLLDEAIIKGKQAVNLGGSSYSLACAYALNNDKALAFIWLEHGLSKNEYKVDHVATDENWEAFWENEDFKNLLQKYRSA